MNAVYDHIVAIVFIGIMFVWAISVVPQMSLNNIQTVNQQQLRNMETNIFNDILLDTGIGFNGTHDTPDWGSVEPFSQNIVNRFGLASASKKELFTLDPDKIQRLAKENPLGFITYETTKQLLGLEGYDFVLQIVPTFNVTNVDGTKIDAENTPIDLVQLQSGVLDFQVRVVYLDQRPIPGASIQSMALYTEGLNFGVIELDEATTDALGFSQRIHFELGLIPHSVMVIMKVSVADVATIVVTFGQHVNDMVNVNMVGDEVILTEPKDPNNAVVWLMNLYCYSSDGLLPHLYTGGKTNENKINTGSGNFELWSKNFPGLKALDPVVLILDISAVDDGRRELIVAGPYQNLLGYTVFEFGSMYAGQSPIVSTQRSVVISGMTYTAQFILWKNSA